MGLNEYILGLNNLEKIYRAPGFFKFTEHSVAAHSFRVASIAQVLGDIEESKGTVIDWKNLYEKALNHDYTERFIGDIKTPVKYASPELRRMLHVVEEKMTEQFIQQEIPPEFQAIYRKRLAEGKDETIEGELLAIADKIDLLYESFEEIIKNNPEVVYQEMFVDALQTIADFRHRPSVQYFLTEIFPDILKEQLSADQEFIQLINAIIQ